MTKYFVKFVFIDGSEFFSGVVFNSLYEANDHGEFMLKKEDWNRSDCQVVRYVIGTAEIRFTL